MALLTVDEHSCIRIKAMPADRQTVRQMYN